MPEKEVKVIKLKNGSKIYVTDDPEYRLKGVSQSIFTWNEDLDEA